MALLVPRIYSPLLGLARLERRTTRATILEVEEALVAAAEVVAGPRIPVAVNTGDRDVSLRILKIKHYDSYVQFSVIGLRLSYYQQCTHVTHFQTTASCNSQEWGTILQILNKLSIEETDSNVVTLLRTDLP
jgi:hypothetical protein